MRAKRNLIAAVVFLLAGAWIAPVPIPSASASDATATTAVIVQGTTEAAAHAAVAAHHGTVTRDLWIVNGVAAVVPAGEVPALEAEPGILHVTTDVAVHVQDANPSPLHAASAVYPKVVGADRLWPEGIDGDGVTVAVLDTGIANVADLSGRVVGGVDFSGGNNPYNDEFGHGTFVAG
ncbi:MAG: serine protease AprX, partial [Actinomycetota bacterium]|nr:serine protease AprX [Actinomycetota bacterium]